MFRDSCKQGLFPLASQIIRSPALHQKKQHAYPRRAILITARGSGGLSTGLSDVFASSIFNNPIFNFSILIDSQESQETLQEQVASIAKIKTNRRLLLDPRKH